MKKKGLLAALSIMAVGFAAVSTTLYINGTSTINSNDKDFKVYYSNALVNGTQDLSVVVDETHLSFTTTLDTLGDTYILDYDVTNGSKNYDAALTMNCTGGNEYLTVTNEFDTSSNLAALATRGGKLTLTQIKSNAGDDINVTIDCNIKANAVERNSLGSGTAANPVEPLSKWFYTDSDNDGEISVGDIYTIENESLNVISQTEESVTLLAQYGIGSDYRQTSNEYRVSFSSLAGWYYSPGPLEIDIFSWSSQSKKLVEGYVSYLQRKTGTTSISGNLITLLELKELGCTISDDYSYSEGYTCANSKHAEWLLNDQWWWTRSADEDSRTNIWTVSDTGTLYSTVCSSKSRVVRPVITISKDALNNL